jgi:hypothetical protein
VDVPHRMKMLRDKQQKMLPNQVEKKQDPPSTWCYINSLNSNYHDVQVDAIVSKALFIKKKKRQQIKRIDQLALLLTHFGISISCKFKSFSVSENSTTVDITKTAVFY